MNITILGSGNVGGSLALVWSKKGHRIFIGARNPDSSNIKNVLRESPANITIHPISEAARLGDIIVMAVPVQALHEVINKMGNVRGKLIVDCLNPINGNLEGFNSVSEAIKAWTGSFRIIKAFNTTGSRNLMFPTYGKLKIDTFICGDHEGDKDLIKNLAVELGFDPIDAGGLENASLLESLAKLWVNLAYRQRLGSDIAFKLLKRS